MTTDPNTQPERNSPAAAPVAATTITTPSDGLAVQWNAVATADGRALPVYIARPRQPGPLPVVVVVQEIFGVHAHIADVARRFARLGCLAVAPELFFRRGDPQTAPDVETLRRDFVARTPDAQVLADLDRTLDFAVDQGGDPGRLGLAGFCWGGRIAWLMAAHQPRLKAVAAWYGRLAGERNETTPQHPGDVAAQVSVPVLGLYGGQDQGIPLRDVEAQRDALRAAGKDSRIVIYPDAGHAFFADYRASYRAESASDGWRRMRSWFTQHGVL